MLNESPFLFLNRNNQHLAGVLHLPRNSAGPPVIIMSHGFTDDKVSDNRLFVQFSRQAQEEGYAVLRFDYAGSGDSEGDFADMTVSGEMQDLLSAIDFIKTVRELTHSPVYLVGYSLGGAVALAVASRDTRVQGFIGWAPASNLIAVFHAILGKETFLKAFKGETVECRNDSKQFILKPGFFSDLTQHQPLCDIAKLAPRPVLLIQGTADSKVLLDHTSLLYAATEGPKTLHVIQNAPHSFALYEHELFKTTFRYLHEWGAKSGQMIVTCGKKTRCDAVNSVLPWMAL